MKKIAILGASGHGGVVADIAQQCGYTDVVFFDDAWPEKKKYKIWEVAGNCETLIDELAKFDSCIVAIGDCSIRNDKHHKLKSNGAKFATLIHPSAVISKYAIIGEGSIICEGAIVKAFSTVGSSCIINTSATIGHDVTVGDCVHVSSGSNIAGHVIIHDNTWIGIGSSINQCIVVGANVMVGSGSVVVKNVPGGLTVAGVPAKPLLK